MDPVSATASIIAIIQISGSVISLCYQYIGSVKDAHGDIAKVLSEVASLKVILEEVKVQADKAVTSGQPQVAAMFDMLMSTDGPLASCQAALGLIRDKLGQGLETTHRKKLLWPLKERSVAKVLDFIQRQKGTLLLCLCTDMAQVTVQLEHVLRENSLSISQIQESLNENLEVTLRIGDTLDISQAREYRQRLIKWLRAPDSSSNHNTACELHDSDTGGWLLASNEWSQWLKSPGNVFWLHGMPGCGKTILCSTAIECLRQHPNNCPDSTVLYFYFDFSDTEKRSVEGLLRSLLSQVVSKTVGVPEAVKKLFDEYGDNRQPTVASLKSLLMQMLKDCQKTIVLLDALDECSERGPLLRLLSDIHEQCSKSINLLLTSRKERDLEVVLGKFATQNVPMQQAAVDGDIKSFLQNQLSADSRLKCWPEKVKSEIVETLSAKSEGMFRWVICQLDVLRNCYDYPSVKKRLRELPDTLDATYEKILLSIPPHYQQLAHDVLQWLSFSLRPITLGEVADAAVVNRKDKRFNIEDRLFDITNVLDICSSLVILAETGVDNIARPRKAKRESEKELRLAHYSVKEFLLSNRIQSGPAMAFAVTEIDAHECLGEACLIYLLSFDKLDSLYEGVWEEFPLLDYAASRWYKHCRLLPASRYDILDLSLHLLDAKNECYSNWLRIYDPEHGNRHQLSSKADSFAAPLYYAVSMSHSEAIKHLLRHGADINVKGGFLGFPLQAAAIQDDDSIAKLLLEQGADIHIRGGLYGHTLPATILYKHCSIAKMLIERGVSPDADGERRRYIPLHMAAYYGHQEMVQLLIDKGADVNIYGTVYGTALLAAIESRYTYTSSTKTILKLLIDAGAKVNFRAGPYDHPQGQMTPLAAAAYRGDESIVRLLLEHGASPLVRGSWGSPREIAARGGHEDISQLLVGHGALSAEHQHESDANLKTLFSENERSLDHRGRILQFLLANGANPSVLDENEREEGRTLLDSITDEPSPTDISGVISYLGRMAVHESEDEDRDRLEAPEPSVTDQD